MNVRVEFESAPEGGVRVRRVLVTTQDEIAFDSNDFRRDAVSWPLVNEYERGGLKAEVEVIVA